MIITYTKDLGTHNGTKIYQHDIDKDFHYIVKHGCEFSSCTMWVDKITDKMEVVSISGTSDNIQDYIDKLENREE